MAANREKGEVDLVVGERTYTLTLKTMGLIALQKHFSESELIADLSDIWQKASAGSLEHVVAIFWASFQRYHPDMTYEKAADLVDSVGGVEALNQQLQALSGSTTPDPDDVKALANPPKAQPTRGRGGRSTSKAAASV